MEKTIKTELFKMSAIMVVLVGLGIYAHEFVIAGIQAKMALNLSIFGLFGIAAGISFRHVLSLRNEVVALHALQVDYGAKSKRPKDPYIKPAIVFNEPELLGQGYRLIAEELGKQDELQISNSTVQTLLHDVDQRINDRKSTTLYFSGLMVFLGLLGAFMGLMKTVHSVSELIGAMDVSGKGGTDSFGKMIEGMKAPLNGMSVGFSSSLFGLMTSMVLGALERCSTAAMKSLRNEFEHWLSNMAALESAQQETGGRSVAEFSAVRKVLEQGSHELVEIRGALLATGQGVLDNRADIDHLTRAVSALTMAVQQMADPRPLMRPITTAVEDLARNQLDMIEQFRNLYAEAEADRAHIRSALTGLGALVERSATLDGPELHRQLDRLIVLQGEQVGAAHGHGAPAHGGAMPAVTVPADPDAMVVDAPPQAGLWQRWFGGAASGARAAGGERSLLEARALRREVRDSLAANRRVLRRLGQDIDQRLERLEVNAVLENEAVARLESRARDQHAALATLSATLEQGPVPDLVDGGKPYTGARAEMRSLRNRIGAGFEETQGNAQPPADAAEAPENRRYGTTDRGDL